MRSFVALGIALIFVWGADPKLESIIDSRSKNREQQYIVGVQKKPHVSSEVPGGVKVVMMTDATGRKMRCLMPDGSMPNTEIRAAADEPESEPDSDNRQDVISKIKAELGEVCLKKLVGYWTYAVCPFEMVEQYHLEKGRKQMQFDLGFYVEEKEEAEGMHSELPAYAQYYTEGTQKRKTKIIYKCGKATELKTMLEPEELSYEFVVETPHVCVKKLDPSKQTPYQLILPYQNTCIFLNAGWWTYKYCHLQNVTQFHRENQATAAADGAKTAANWVTVADFGLGEFPKSVKPSEMSSYGKLVIAAKPEDTYLSYKYVGGTACDIGSLHKRETEVRWYCNAEETNAIASIKEVSSCKYQMRVVAKSLCSHPAFAPVKALLHEIDCRPVQEEKLAEDEEQCGVNEGEGDTCTEPSATAAGKEGGGPLPPLASTAAAAATAVETETETKLGLLETETETETGTETEPEIAD